MLKFCVFQFFFLFTPNHIYRGLKSVKKVLKKKKGVFCGICFIYLDIIKN